MPLRPNDSPGFLLWHATLRWQRGVARALAPLDLTHVQFVLLACIWWLNAQGERPSQIALAAQAGTDIKMTSQVLRSLERKGLIEREVDTADTRARKLRVTERGARQAPRAIAIVEQVDSQFFADVPAAEALRILRRLAQLPKSGCRTGLTPSAGEVWSSAPLALSSAHRRVARGPGHESHVPPSARNSDP